MNFFDISVIEDTVSRIVRSCGVSEHIFTNRPKTIGKDVRDFVVVGVQGDVEDMAAYGKCIVNVSLFAKDTEYRKNPKKLSLMQRKFFDGFPPYIDVTDGRGDFNMDFGKPFMTEGETVASYIFDDTPTVSGDIGDNFEFHCRMIQIETLIKVL